MSGLFLLDVRQAEGVSVRKDLVDINVTDAFRLGITAFQTASVSYLPSVISDLMQRWWFFRSIFETEGAALISHVRINPLRPNNDLNQTSPCNIKGLSVSGVMRIENMITQMKFY